MAIVRSTNTTGAKSNTTLRGNISLEHGEGELVSYQNNNGRKAMTYKVDVNGVHYYDIDEQEIARFSADGIHYYSSNGTELVKFAPDGTHYYNDTGREIVKIDNTGMGFYNTSGNLISKITETGTAYYNTSGVKIAEINSTGTMYYNASGVKIAQIDATGTHYYNASGNEITKISTDGFDYYDTNSVKRINIGASSAGKMRIEMYDTDGTPRTWIGQNPSSGDQVLAVTTYGNNVETELNS